MPDVDDPAWPQLRDLLGGAATELRVLPVDPARGQDTLARLRLSLSSTLGALALNCGGIVADHGWLRMLGGGCVGLPDLATASGLASRIDAVPGALTVAYDVLGGRFAIDGGGLGCAPGEVCYLGPDTLSWGPMGGGHTAFIDWAVGGGLADFYADLRWPGWESEALSLALDEGIAVHPFLWTAEGRAIARASRSVVPFAELLDLHDDMAGRPPTDRG